jgi:hypothetical protein
MLLLCLVSGPRDSSLALSALTLARKCRGGSRPNFGGEECNLYKQRSEGFKSVIAEAESAIEKQWIPAFAGMTA